MESYCYTFPWVWISFLVSWNERDKREAYPQGAHHCPDACVHPHVLRGLQQRHRDWVFDNFTKADYSSFKIMGKRTNFLQKIVSSSAYCMPLLLCHWPQLQRKEPGLSAGLWGPADPLCVCSPTWARWALMHFTGSAWLLATQVEGEGEVGPGLPWAFMAPNRKNSITVFQSASFDCVWPFFFPKQYLSISSRFFYKPYI